MRGSYISLSLDKSNPKWKPLHENAEGSSGRRMKKKILAKTNWFKGNKRSNDDEEPAKKSSKEDGGSRKSENINGRKKPLQQEPPTVFVMFVDQTLGGELARRLQEVEDRIAKTTTRYRVKMTEMYGSKLCHLLPNTNPWPGAHCGRADCYTCGQGCTVPSNSHS